MIPEWWLDPLVNVWCTVILATMTGGDPALKITEDGLQYGVRYRKG